MHSRTVRLSIRPWQARKLLLGLCTPTESDPAIWTTQAPHMEAVIWMLPGHEEFSYLGLHWFNASLCGINEMTSCYQDAVRCQWKRNARPPFVF